MYSLTRPNNVNNEKEVYQIQHLGLQTTINVSQELSESQRGAVTGS